MNELVSLGRDGTPRQRPALLVLEDGTTMRGRSCGSPGEAFGEVVFNTAVAGYEQVVSDPSYAGQLVCLTYPQIGNYGVNDAALQSRDTGACGLIVRDMCFEPSSWTSSESLPVLLERCGIVAIEGVDTRALTLTIRSAGAMRGAISTEDLDPEHLLTRVRQSPRISERELVGSVSAKKSTVMEPKASAVQPFSVVAYDCGMKKAIKEGLVAEGMRLEIVPWDTPAIDVLAMHPDGVFFSNGPGDPSRVQPTLAACRALLGRVPVFGICLGNQLISMAAGASIEKLPFGHHGGNEPVMNLLSGRVEVTSQNHGFGLVFESIGPLVAELSGGRTDHAASLGRDLRYWTELGIAPVALSPTLGRVRLTHVNLNDGTPEGIQLLDAAAFSVQYHPESCPGPHDSRYLFAAFRRLMQRWRENGGSWRATEDMNDYLAQGRAEGGVR